MERLICLIIFSCCTMFSSDKWLSPQKHDVVRLTQALVENYGKFWNDLPLSSLPLPMKVDYDCYWGTYMACLISECVYVGLFRDCSQNSHSDKRDLTEKNKEIKKKKQNWNWRAESNFTSQRVIKQVCLLRRRVQGGSLLLTCTPSHEACTYLLQSLSKKAGLL